MKHFNANGMTMSQILGFSKPTEEENDLDRAELLYQKRLARLDQIGGGQVLSNGQMPDQVRHDVLVGEEVQVKADLSIPAQVNTSFVPYITSVGKQCLQPMAYGIKLIAVLIFICCLFNNEALAQSRDTLGAVDGVGEVTPLQIGDAIPDALWNAPLQVVNHPDGKETITLADFKDKLIILDFWATWCSSCIKNFPVLYSLGREYDQDLQVILVNSKSTKDEAPDIGRFLTKRQEVYRLTSVVEDTVLKQLFPHRSIPHYIWIKQGRVVGISNSDGLTHENVEYALRDEVIDPSKARYIDYDPAKPLFENGNAGKAPAYIYKSILTPYVEGLPRRIYRNDNEEGLVDRLTVTNSTLVDFYRFAYPDLAQTAPARWVWEATASEASSAHPMSVKKTADLYNYEARFPLVTREDAMAIFRADLQRFFGYIITPMEREVSCWILQMIDPGPATDFPQTLPRETNLNEGTGMPIFFHNYPLSSLLHQLERIYQVTFVDETGITVPVRLSLPAQLDDMAKLQSSLADQGLLLRKEKRTINMIHISKK